MRITEKEVNLLKDNLKLMDALSQLYLFGSRVDDSKKGGDIDLLVKSEKLNRADIRKLRIDFCRHFGEQKIDIVLDDGVHSSAFLEKIRKQAVRL